MIQSRSACFFIVDICYVHQRKSLWIHLSEQLLHLSFFFTPRAQSVARDPKTEANCFSYECSFFQRDFVTTISPFFPERATQRRVLFLHFCDTLIGISTQNPFIQFHDLIWISISHCAQKLIYQRLCDIIYYNTLVY